MPKTKPTIITGRKPKGVITKSNKIDPVIHIDLPAEDTELVRKFYESAFGWQTTKLSPEMGDFILAFTIETDEKTRMPKKRGAINGGFYKKTNSDQNIRLTILVVDIQSNGYRTIGYAKS